MKSGGLVDNLQSSKIYTGAELMDVADLVFGGASMSSTIAVKHLFDAGVIVPDDKIGVDGKIVGTYRVVKLDEM